MRSKLVQWAGEVGQAEQVGKVGQARPNGMVRQTNWAAEAKTASQAGVLGQDRQTDEASQSLLGDHQQAKQDEEDEGLE